MIAIRNKENKELQLQFEGDNYFFPKDTVVLVEENLKNYLEEVWPLAFDYEVKVPKDQIVAKARFVKIKSKFDNGKEKELDMVISNKMEADTLTPEQDTQGADFYGPGIETDLPIKE